MARQSGYLLQACLWICISVVVVSSQKENVFSIFGKSVTMRCPLEPKSDIKWYDFVYSLSAGKPAVIYEDGVTIDDEYHGNRFSVDPDTMELTISDLNEDDVGVYFCQTTESEKQEFQLDLGSELTCQPSSEETSDLRENTEVDLNCEMEYFGSAPDMSWLREGEMIDSDDMTNVQKAQHKVKVTVDYTMNQQMFTCRAVVGDMVEECSLDFTVKYGVRDVMVAPKKDSYAPGEEFICSAKGNPTPRVKVTLPDGEIKEGQNEVKVVIAEEWDGTTQSIFCEAFNQADGMPVSESVNYTFSTMTKSEPDPEGSQGETVGDGDVTGASTQTIAIVAGIVIGAVVLVVIIIAVVCVKKKQSQPPKDQRGSIVVYSF